MKNIVASFALFLAFIAFTGFKAAQEPELKFEKETNDFGKVPQGKPVTYDFKFTNTGDQPLIIKSVESTCGCTVPKYTSAPLQKGATGVISVTYNAAAAGSFSKPIIIKSNAKTPLKYLYIKGEVVQN